MNIVVDGQPGFLGESTHPSVMEAVTAINAKLREQGRAILSLRVDGKDVLPEELLRKSETLQDESCDELVVQSEDISKLVNDALENLRTTLPELPKACHELATVFHGESPEEGYEPFHRLAGIWSSIKTTELQVAQALGLELDQVSIEGESLKAIHDELNEFLSEAAQALQSNDCVALGDLLEYELAPRAETEAGIVEVLQTEAQHRAL